MDPCLLDPDEKTTATQSLPKQRAFDASYDRSTGVPTYRVNNLPRNGEV